MQTIQLLEHSEVRLHQKYSPSLCTQTALVDAYLTHIMMDPGSKSDNLVLNPSLVAENRLLLCIYTSDPDSFIRSYELLLQFLTSKRAAFNLSVDSFLSDIPISYTTANSLAVSENITKFTKDCSGQSSLRMALSYVH